MYGKIMAVRDDLIIKYFTLCTRLPESEISKIEKELKGGGNPRDAKARLAREVVALYHGEKKALVAEGNFVNIFSKGGIPEDLKEVSAERGSLLVDVLLKEKQVSSKSEWRRLVEGGGVEVSGENIYDSYIKVSGSMIVRIGKKRFIKIISR
jgi:tyrosyl-tRNA synthetase